MLIKILKLKLFPLFFFITFFAVYFIHYPISMSIPGNCDSWLVISLSNLYLSKIKAYILGVALTTPLYPSGMTHSFGEASPGLALLFIIFKCLSLNDIYSYYLYLVGIFSLSSFGVYYLTNYYLNDKLISIIAGASFMMSNFIIANIDDTPLIFYFIPCLGTVMLQKFFDSEDKKYLYISSLLLAIQVYFSVYVFVFHGIIYFFIYLFNFKRMMSFNNGKHFIVSYIYLLVVIFPMIYFYLSSHYEARVINPFNLSAVIKSCSITMIDFFRSLTGNAIYRSIPTSLSDNYWAVLRRSAFIGATFGTISLYGMKCDFKKNLWMILIIICGVLISFGPSLQLGNSVIAMPMSLVYKYIPLSKYFRVPSRAFILSVMFMSFFFAVGVKNILTNVGSKKIYYGFLLMLVTFNSIENISFSPIKYDISKLHKVDKAYANFFKNKKSVILNLPSTIGTSFIHSKDLLFEYNREIIYMNWQTQLDQNIVNGINGYFSKDRIELQKVIDNLPNNQSVYLLKKIGVKHIVYHKKLLLSYENDIYKLLLKSDKMFVEVDNEQVTVFSI